MTSRSNNSRLEEIVERIDRIRVAEELLSTFEKEGNHQQFQIVFDSILYQLVVIGEAVKDLDPNLLAKHQEIAWKDIAGMRDFLVHQYHRTDAKIVRDTIETQLDALRNVCLMELELCF